MTASKFSFISVLFTLTALSTSLHRVLDDEADKTPSHVTQKKLGESQDQELTQDEVNSAWDYLNQHPTLKESPFLSTLLWDTPSTQLPFFTTASAKNIFAHRISRYLQDGIPGDIISLILLPSNLLPFNGNSYDPQKTITELHLRSRIVPDLYELLYKGEAGNSLDLPVLPIADLSDPVELESFFKTASRNRSILFDNSIDLMGKIQITCALLKLPRAQKNYIFDHLDKIIKPEMAWEDRRGKFVTLSLFDLDQLAVIVEFYQDFFAAIMPIQDQVVLAYRLKHFEPEKLKVLQKNLSTLREFDSWENLLDILINKTSEQIDNFLNNLPWLATNRKLTDLEVRGSQINIDGVLKFLFNLEPSKLAKLHLLKDQIHNLFPQELNLNTPGLHKMLSLLFRAPSEELEARLTLTPIFFGMLYEGKNYDKSDIYDISIPNSLPTTQLLERLKTIKKHTKTLFKVTRDYQDRANIILNLLSVESEKVDAIVSALENDISQNLHWNHCLELISCFLSFSTDKIDILGKNLKILFAKTNNYGSRLA